MVIELPTVPDVPTTGNDNIFSSIFSQSKNAAPVNADENPFGKIFGGNNSGAVSTAVDSLKTPTVNIPEGFDISKTSPLVPTKDEITQKYGTSTSISAPKVTAPTGNISQNAAGIRANTWSKIGNFFTSAHDFIFGDSKARTSVVEANTDAVNNQPYVDIAKQLGIDQAVKPDIPAGIDESKLTPNVLQYYKEQSAANAVKNNWSVIQKTYPDLELPDKVTSEQIDKALGVNPNSAMGTAQGIVAILGTALLADTGVDIVAALAEGGGLDASLIGGAKVGPTLVNLAKATPIFIGFDKILTPLREELVKKGNIGDGGQALLYIAQQTADILATHGAVKGVDKITDLFAKHTIEGFQLPQTVNLSGADIQKILGVRGGLTETQFNQMADDLGWNEDTKNAAKNGAMITIPAKQIITTADRPWWGKVKDFFGFEPTSETTITKTGGGVEPFAGQVEGDAVPKEGDLMNLAKQITVPHVETGGDFNAGEISKMAMRFQAKPESVSPEPQAKKYNTPTDFIKNNLHLLNDSSEIEAVRQGIKPIAIQAINNTNVSEAKGLNQFKANVNGTDMIIVYKNGQESNAHKLVNLFNSDKSGPEFHAAVGKLLGYTDQAISDFNSGKHEVATYNQTIDQLTDLYNKSQGLDTNGKPIENKGYGNNTPGALRDLPENRQGTGNDAGRSGGLVQPGDNGNFVQAAERHAQNSGGGGEDNQLLSGLGQKLDKGKRVEIDKDSLGILKEYGFSQPLVENIKLAQKSGGVKYVVASPTHEGNPNYLSAYNQDTLFLNPAELDHSTYKNGSIINHEIAGHSWYRKLDQENRQAFFDDLKANKNTIREAWEKSDNAHQNYWNRTLQEVTEKISLASTPEIADALATEFGLIFNEAISLDSFIDRSLNIDKNIQAINAELARRGFGPINLEARNTTAIEEHVAMLSEQAGEIRGQTPMMDNYLGDVSNQTLKYGPESTDKLVYPGEKELTLKTLEKLKGRTTVSKQFISDLTNAADLKQQERDIIRDALKTEGNIVNVLEFADKVKAEILPIKRSGPSGTKYENISLPSEIRGNIKEYGEKIYSSPVKTSAGQIHFNGRMGEHLGSNNYFGHTRVEDMADDSTRRIIEVQSDLFQKGGLDSEFPIDESFNGIGSDYLDLYRKGMRDPNEIFSKLLETRDFTKASVSELQRMSNATDGLVKNKIIPSEEGSIRKEVFNKLAKFAASAENAEYDARTKELARLQNYTNPTAHFRMVREEIKQAAKDGKTALQFPTGETAMKIEGLGESQRFVTVENGRGTTLTPEMLKVGREIGFVGDIMNGEEGGEWIITDVLGDGKFKAIPKDRLLVPSDEMLALKKQTENDTGGYGLIDGKIYIKSQAEEFDISGKVDTNNPIYRFYEKDLGRYLKNNYNAKPVTDAQGVTWYEVPIKPEMASEPVTAFREKTKDLDQLRRMLDRETQSLNAAISNPEAHAKAYGENKIPIYQERIKDLKARITEAKNPTFNTGNTLEDARASLQAVLKRTGVKPTEMPTMKVDGQDVPMPVDLFERELNSAFKEEAIKENPLNELWKYANKKEGTLPEITGRGKSKFGREGDDILSREAFAQFADDTGKVDTETVREKFAAFVEEKRQFRDELKDLEAERRQFIDQARIDLAQKAEIERKEKRLGFTVPEYTEKSPLASVPELIAAEDLIRVHPGRAFMKYVNNRTGILPEIDKEFPGTYGNDMEALLKKKGFTLEDAQKAVDNYITHVDQLFLMTEDTFNPIEMGNSLSVFETNAFQAEKARLANDPNAKPLETIFEQADEYPLKKKAGALDFLRTPDRVLKKIGLSDESELIKKKYNDYLKELPKNIQKITDWSKRVPNKDSAQKIFNYLNGTPGPGGFIEPDFLTAEEKRVGDEIKDWLKEWATRLHLRPHERLDNYITHIFEEDLIKKEFDQDLAKIIQDKVPGEVYDPFLQQRLGALGYVQDVFRALDAYVKRATRKVHMDVALHKVKVAAEKLDVDSYNYVKQYVDRINLRPTKIDNYIDNSIKQILGVKALGGNSYRLGARPTARITRAGRQLVYRGTLGLNIGSALKNLSQGMNTFAELGPQYTLKGYISLLNGLNQAELVEENIFGQDIIQDRTLSATKKFWEKFDKTIFFAFEAAEKINRGAAYFGAKAKYYAENTRVDKKTGIRIWSADSSELKARAYARRMVEKTQFTFGSVDTPLALGSDIMKTVAQFQSFNLKQAEFLTEMARNKNYKGLLRYLLAGLIIMITLGKLFKMAWKDLIPFSRYGLPPLVSAPLALVQAALGTPDKFGNTPSTNTRLKNAMYALLPFAPAGVQGSKTVRGLQSTQTGAPLGTKIRSAIFGPVDSANAQKIMTAITKSSAAGQTNLNGLDSSIADTGTSTWEQVKKLGVGTEEADALVSDLSEDEYKAYGYAKAADGSYWVDIAQKVAPIVDQASKAGFGSDEADSLVNDLSDDEYSSYKTIKDAIYGKGSSGPTKWDQQTFLEHVSNVAHAWGTDPITAFEDLTQGDWRVEQLKNGQIIVRRNDQRESAERKALGANSSVILDHIKSLELGGNNSIKNMWLVPKEQSLEDDQVENLLGKALGDGRITGKQAQEYELRYKKSADADYINDRTKKIFDAVGDPMTFDDIQAAIK